MITPFLLVAFAARARALEDQNIYYLHEYGGYQYALLHDKMKMTFEEARAFCHSHCGELASIHSQSEVDFLILAAVESENFCGFRADRGICGIFTQPL
ncbi:hypothetical protein Y032_0010g909 [Ancylostoma ceylanicum]|uniref:C-type lectin domain-containing protein n=1 Tax=Ancylostoma ceylanicum TaxID=53326 RepID=A0A016VHC3_9BILA|nr:hypothetical protein Y032_0010g909 [Ancylostoma ceylanicum]